MMRFLSERGADVNAKKDSYSILYHIAVIGEQSGGVVSLLFELGADASQKELTSALFAAAGKGHGSVIQALAGAGADVNARQEGDHVNLEGLLTATPLHIAIMARQVGAVRALLEAGADFKARYLDASHGPTPLKLASKQTCVINSCEMMGGANLTPPPFQIIVALVAAGDREWKFVPAPCPYLERALSSVWLQAPEDLSELFKRLESPVKAIVREALKVLQVRGRLPKELGMLILGAVFDQVSASQADEKEEDEVQRVSGIKRKWRVFKLVVGKMTWADYAALCAELPKIICAVILFMVSFHNLLLNFIIFVALVVFLAGLWKVYAGIKMRVGQQTIMGGLAGLTATD